MSLYVLSEIKRIYDKRTVLDIPSYTFDERCIYAVLGANGAGKSTLLSMLGFMQAPSKGTLRFRNKKIQFVENELQHLRQEVVLVDQKPLLFSTTVHKNLEFGLKIRKVPKERRRARIEEVLDLVGMGQFQHKMAVNLSGGETQRIALARALVLNPRVLLCDEPTASVDSVTQKSIVQLLRKINAEKGISIIFSTHDDGLAVDLAHDTLHLSSGKIGRKRKEIIFCSTIQKDDSGRHCCVLPGGVRLFLSSGFNKKTLGETVTLAIDPWSIIVAKKDQQLPETNQLRAQVLSVELDKKGVKVKLDAGVPLTSMISNKDYEKSKFFAGEEVVTLIHPDEIKAI